MNYLTQKWSQVQNDHKNDMTIDISELTINVLYKWNADLFTIVQKKGFLIFLTVTWQPFMKYHSPPSFPSRNITKNAETQPTPMRHVIIEQLLYQTIDWNVWGVVQQEIAESNCNSKYFTALFSQSSSGRLLLLHIIFFVESTSALKYYSRPGFFYFL